MPEFLFTDWRGNDVYVGDTIIYPIRHGSTVNVAEAIVLSKNLEPIYKESSTLIPKLLVTPIRDKYGARSGKNVKLENLKLVTKVQAL